MKKNIGKLLLIGIVFFVSTQTVNANIYPMWQKNTNQIETLEDLLQDKDNIKSYEKYLLDKYGENYKEIFKKNAESAANAEKIHSLFTKAKSGETMFPDYIGGLYINDKEELVIQMVEKNIPLDSKNSEYSNYKNILNVDKTAKIEYVQYSYNELYNINNKILDYYSKNKSNGNVIGFYIDTKTNKIVVELKSIKNSEIENFKNNVIKSNLVTFTEGIENVDYANLVPGTKINGFICSYGYRAKLNGKNGIVTAGHCFTKKGDPVGNIGTVKEWNNSGHVDAAWIETNSNNIPQNYMNSIPKGFVDTLSPTQVITTFTEGQLLAKIGYVSGFTSGKVTKPIYNPLPLSMQVRTDFYATHGDSGGIVFQFPFFNPGGTNVIGYSVAGIVKGGPNGGGIMYFTRADRTNSMFKITRY